MLLMHLTLLLKLCKLRFRVLSSVSTVYIRSCLSMAYSSISKSADEVDRGGYIEKAQDCLLQACVLEPWNVSLLQRYVALDSESASLLNPRIEKLKKK